MRCVILTSTFCLIFSSCFNSSENDLIVFKTTNEGLQKSNQFISGQTELLYQALKDKTLSPQLHDRAEIWYPRALQIKQLSSDILKYIDKLKTDLKKEAGLKLIPAKKLSTAIKNLGSNVEEEKITDKNKATLSMGGSLDISYKGINILVAYDTQFRRKFFGQQVALKFRYNF